MTVARAPVTRFSGRRVAAMVRRHLYLFRGSWARTAEIVYWPGMQVMLWGFITRFFLEHSSWLAQAAGALLAGVLLWDILFRGQLGLSVSFMEEIYSRNLGQLFVSPLTSFELVAALILMSLMRALAGMLPATAIAWLLYDYSLYDLGLPLLAFFFNLLVFAWGIGLVVAAVLLRAGLGAENLAWVSMFAIAPFSAVYYPVASLPGFVQPLAWALPSSHVFEGMRAVMITGEFRADLLFSGFGLALVYLAIGAAVFLWSFHVARVRGLILQQGE